MRIEDFLTYMKNKDEREILVKNFSKKERK